MTTKTGLSHFGSFTERGGYRSGKSNIRSQESADAHVRRREITVLSPSKVVVSSAKSELPILPEEKRSWGSGVYLLKSDD